MPELSRSAQEKLRELQDDLSLDEWPNVTTPSSRQQKIDAAAAEGYTVRRAGKATWLVIDSAGHAVETVDTARKAENALARLGSHRIPTR